jgi:hypothetical protein
LSSGDANGGVDGGGGMGMVVKVRFEEVFVDMVIKGRAPAAPFRNLSRLDVMVNYYSWMIV